MNPKSIKKLLLSEIKRVSSTPARYAVNPKSSFTRNRKIPIQKLISTIIGMESKNLSNEVIDAYGACPDLPSVSAFVQQRSKLKPEAFQDILKEFTARFLLKVNKDMPILAVDGSDVQIPTNPDDKDSYYPGTRGQEPYNLMHVNALFHLKEKVYIDVLLQKVRDYNEHKAIQEMIDRSPLKKALIIADRGYESYNTMAHAQEKGWYYLIRIKDGNYGGIKAGLSLPKEDCYDMAVELKLTRKQTTEVKELLKDKNHYRFLPTSTPFDYLSPKSKKSDPLRFYELRFRIVRFKVSENQFESVITNLDAECYPPEELKRLYSSRWGIETSFRDLKLTMGMLNYHTKKVMCIQQEIYANMIMYNFAEMITSHVFIRKKQRKYTYKANFSVAAHVCRLFYHGKTTSPNLEAIIAQHLIPIRPGRHNSRSKKLSGYHSFMYRIA